MIGSDPEGRLAPLDETLFDKARLMARNLGNLVLGRFAAASAEFKLAMGLDATSPFGPREAEYLRTTGNLGNQSKE